VQEPTDGPGEAVPGWPVYVDDVYGYTVQYPEGWTYEEVDLDAPDKPPAGNMARLIFFAPAGWDEDFIALQMEVYDMDEVTFRLELPPATSEEVITRDDGLTYTKLVHDYGQVTMYQYLFRSSSDPDVRVIFTDYVSGWPDRLEGNEAVAEVFTPVLASFGFTH
jgi:hypothetical protein